MALTYNGTSPLSIIYNNTDLTVLKYGTTNVWGKAYTLTFDQGSHTNITVNRTSSPNQHATTGSMASGSLIYYGDVLTISYTVDSGYAIATHTLNGTTFTSGTSHTVTGNVTVITTAQASGPSWHTVWSGNKYIYPSSSWVNVATNLTANVPTRVNGYFEIYEEWEGELYPYDSKSLSNATLPQNFSLGNSGLYWRSIIIELNGTTVRCYTGSGAADDFSGYITKVEQYY